MAKNVAKNCAVNCGALAQLVERAHGMGEVRGSIPLSSTKFMLRILEAWLWLLLPL